MKKTALLFSTILAAGFTLVSCGGGGPNIAKPPSGLTTRVFASQSVSSPTAFPGVVIVNASNDTPARASEISAGSSPGLMAVSSSRATLLVFSSTPNNNSVAVVNTQKETETGTIPLAGPTTSMVVLDTGFAYAAVPSAPFQAGAPQGAVQVMNLTVGGITASVSVPNAQTVVATPDGSQLLVFSNDSNSVTIMSPLLVNTGVPVTTSVSGFDSPVNAVFSSDGNTAYILNCGAQCGGTQASVQILNLNTTPPTAGAKVLVNGATIGLVSGSTLYVAGTGTPNGPLCSSIKNAAPTSAPYCGTLDIVDLTTLQDPYYNNPATEIAITDGYHDRIDMSSNGQLFIGSHTCTFVNTAQEVRGCLSIYNTTNGTVVIPPDNGDVTGLQSFNTRYVEYVAEGGNLRVYDTTIDKLLVNDIINGTIGIAGQIIDIKAVDFF